MGRGKECGETDNRGNRGMSYSAPDHSKCAITSREVRHCRTHRADPALPASRVEPPCLHHACLLRAAPEGDHRR